MKDYYDSIAAGYEELHKEEQLKKVAFVKKFVKVNSKDKLLDVGCGTGISTEMWKCNRYGIDPSEKLLNIGRALRPDIKFYKGSAEKLPFKAREFDFVISITAIQNFTDIEKGLKEIKRVGKGSYVLTFLKRSPKRKEIINQINQIFDVETMLEEEKDLVFII